LLHDGTTTGAFVVRLSVSAAASQGPVGAAPLSRAFRAQSGSLPLGTYTTARAAQKHCEADLADRHPGADIQTDWLGDDSDT
ncbi:hypothetical protein G3I76_17065, partial [Streptomyces sp. SID11233]|nr:hypothetical protein [Streptomyces sp. SID11233]